MKYSPFRQLVNILEEEAFDLTLKLQVTPPEKLNQDFILGYRSALNYMLLRAYGIYNRRVMPNTLTLDMSSEEAAVELIKALKEG